MPVEERARVLLAEQLSGDSKAAAWLREGRFWEAERLTINQALRAIQRALVDRPGQDAVVEGWQDISTAPKDGTRILVGGGRMFCESLGEYVTAPMSVQWEGPAHKGYWLVGGRESGYACLGYDDPTHWQPLPALSPTPSIDAIYTGDGA